MINIHNNVLDPTQIADLLTYFNKEDDTVDARPDVRSKHPIWGQTQWPENIIKTALDNILDYDYVVEEIVFFQSKISYSLHVDSGRSDHSRDGNVIIFPLKLNGVGTTVLFNNFWNRDSTRFSKVKIEPFEYNLSNKFNELTYVKDLRELLTQCIESPSSVIDFDVTREFIDTIHYLIEARQDKKTSKVDGRCYDYTDMVNWDKDQQFDKSVHHQHLNHIPIETLHGLTINSIVHWNLGDCFSFERTRVHCAGSGHKEKTGLSIFTQRI
jgi:hypothetical protein